MATEYLPLTEYSSKYKVSISTLRRRIKAEDISYVFEDGKYFIQDGPMSTHQRVHRPSQTNSEETLVGAHIDSSAASAIVKESAPMFGFNQNQHGEPTSSEKKKQTPIRTSAPASPTNDEPVLTVANRLLTELKKAYSQILHEKEELILHLKEEIADLKTLVRVLESENDRVTRQRK